MKAITATKALLDECTAVYLLGHEGPEVFEIVHERYTTFANDPAKSRRTGYKGQVHRLVFDEAGTRHELKTFFGLGEDAIDAIITRARHDAGA